MSDTGNVIALSLGSDADIHYVSEQMTQSDDERIIEACRHGDRRAFNELVRGNQQRVYRVVRRIVQDPDDAMDITQDVFVRAYQGLDGFRGGSKIFTWLYRIAVNLSINHVKSGRVRRFFRFDREDGEYVDHAPGIHEGLEREEIRRSIERAIAALPAKQRAVFVLRYYEELPYEDIAGMLGTSVGGLKANYHHAMKKIEEKVRHALS
ncbi:MAG TPA: sigma-70 family RNA polymerase sigma factor [Bacteroidota bacterium]|nr:sigma-70 family RNA polymerase sigma factor [Bacteroidota bacterium]